MGRLWNWIGRRLRSRERLLPAIAYKARWSEAERDRIDRILRRRLREVPTTPGTYADAQGELWMLDADGAWTDPKGVTMPKAYAPALVAGGPWTRIESPHG